MSGKISTKKIKLMNYYWHFTQCTNISLVYPNPLHVCMLKFVYASSNVRLDTLFITSFKIFRRCVVDLFFHGLKSFDYGKNY